MRVLVAGWLNSPHVAGWAEAVAASGHEVQLAGRLVPRWPELSLSAVAHELPASLPPPLRGLHISRELARVARAIKPDVIHAHYLPEYGWMAAREGLAPLVCSAWGSDVFGAGRLVRSRSRRAIDAASLVFADSAHLASATRQLGGPEAKVEIVRWGLDLNRFTPGNPIAARKALGLDPNGPLVAGIRGLKPIYNPRLLLEAFALVRARIPNARLLLKHPLANTPRAVGRAIERLGLGAAVTVLPNVPLDRLPDVYRAADVVVSIPSSDSSPRSVWEALACGRPVVVSDLPWARDELENGRTALLAQLNAAAVAEAIRLALSDEQLGHEGRVLVQGQFDPAACSTRIDALYRSVIDDAEAPYTADRSAS